MAKSTTREPERPESAEPPEPARPPEHVQLYCAPGMNTISAAEILMGFGIRRDLGDWMEGITGQLTTLMTELGELRGEVEGLKHAHETPPRRK